MAKLSFSQLEDFISSPRLCRCLRQSGENHERAVELYFTNLETSKDFYALLHWLEIGLRNRINVALTLGYGERWPDNPALPLEAIERQQLTQARDSLLRQRKPVDSGRIIAALHFGFWVNLFNSPYEELWRKHLRRAFSAHTKTLTRKTLRIELGNIHRLRNRIAHYEPILHTDIPEARKRILDIIEWMDAPEIVALLSAENSTL